MPPSTPHQLIERARTLLNCKIKYDTGGGGRNPNLTPGDLKNTKLDCSGFVAWCLGFDRYVHDAYYASVNGTPAIGRGWFETTAVYQDAKNSKGLVTQITKPVPGCIVVFPDSKVNGVHREGHMGIITEVNTAGVATKVIHCSASAFNQTGDAIAENSIPALLNNAKAIFAWYDALLESPADPDISMSLLLKTRDDISTMSFDADDTSTLLTQFEYFDANGVVKYRAYYINGEPAFFFQSKAAICADGSPHAYKIGDKGLDYLKNAGKPPTPNAPTDTDLDKWKWWGIATDSKNNPVIQSVNEPSPGFFVSLTAHGNWGKYPETDQRCYVDAGTIPYIVLPSGKKHGARLGDFAYVVNKKTGKMCPAIYAEVGPSDQLGELSMKAASMIGLNDDPKKGGTAAKDIFYVLFLNSGNGKPRTFDEIDKNATELFEKWGGMSKVNQLGDIHV